jgi:hypothetical protein
MDYDIQIMFSEPARERFRDKPCFRLHCEVTDALNVTRDIFLFKRSIADPLNDEVIDEFIAICSPFDLSTYPANEPDAQQDPPFFRKSEFDILLPSVASVVEVRTSVTSQLVSLLNMLKNLDRLQDEEPFWINGYEEAPSTGA